MQYLSNPIRFKKHKEEHNWFMNCMAMVKDGCNIDLSFGLSTNYMQHTWVISSTGSVDFRPTHNRLCYSLEYNPNTKRVRRVSVKVQKNGEIQ